MGIGRIRPFRKAMPSAAKTDKAAGDRSPGSAVSERAPQEVLAQMISGYGIAQAVFVAARLGIADALKQEPRTSDQLAASSGVDAGALHRLLRVLAAGGVLREVEPGRFAVTPVGELLERGSALRAAALMHAELYWKAYGELMHTVRTGRSAFRKAAGLTIYEYLAGNPEAEEAYAASMTAGSIGIAAALTGAYDFSGARTVVDVGGGQGAFLARILKANPQLRGVLFDRPPVVEGAQAVLRAEGVAERCEIAGGDFFEAVPAGGDAYILKWVLSDWDDERALAILRSCRRAMDAGGRLLVIEPLDVAANALFNLNLLVVWNGGRVRGAEELGALFAAAGLKMDRDISTPSPFRIVEARKA